MTIKHFPYGKTQGGLGYTSPFSSREEAERVLSHVQSTGNMNARICAHSSMVMTSDNSPIIINVRPDELPVEA